MHAVGAAGRAYAERVAGLWPGVLSRLDAERLSPSFGSFDRTWWCWKFSDFSAPRLQEGVYSLAWLCTSRLAPGEARESARLLDCADAALRFWMRQQHRDGSFDEAYPFERSLAATAFSAFYAACGLERLRAVLPADTASAALRALEGCARWLASNGEFHGVLSNHLAAAAAALQVIADLLGSDALRPARDRYLQIIYREQDPEEGWFREYGGADPGYQSHAMFYLAEIGRRTADAELEQRLARACEFESWFLHPDGSLGGEYASRGTKFAYPAAFEMLAPRVAEARPLAARLRRNAVAGRGVDPTVVDLWNLFPMLNNYLFAAEAASDELPDAALPWEKDGAVRVFERAGLAVANAGGRLFATGPATGGALKLWDAASGALLYEDCGYAIRAAGASSWCLSQGCSRWTRADPEAALLSLCIESAFRAVPTARFDPWRFVAFRLFSLTLGRFPAIARWLKKRLVGALIRPGRPQRARLQRRLRIERDGALALEDRIECANRDCVPLARALPYHMGSSRYASWSDALGARLRPPVPQRARGGFTRALHLRGGTNTEERI